MRSVTITLLIDGVSVSVENRVAAMVVWLTRRQELVNAMGKGGIEFSFAGTSLKVSSREIEEFRISNLNN